MERCNFRLKLNGKTFLFYDSKGANHLNAKAINMLIQKVDELVDEVNELKLNQK